jgi:lipid-A-disaccharide synthase
LKPTPKKIYIIAGEASGDQIGAHLMAALKERHSSYTFYGIGGDKMKNAGLTSLFPMRELSIMGLAEIIPHIRHIFKRIKQTVTHIISVQPDILITIDSSGFTHRVIKRVKKQIKQRNLSYIPSVHYAAPPVWAWRPWRAKSVAKFLDHLLCLYPFEPPYFTKYGLKATFIGHPITEKNTTSHQNNNIKKKTFFFYQAAERQKLNHYCLYF